MASYTQEELDKLIFQAEQCGIVLDERTKMPKGPGKWPRHKADDVIGQCIHQNGSNNFTDYKATANYHVSRNNHITPGRGLPSICYDIAIPDLPGPARVVANFLDRKYEQKAKDEKGDASRHLIAILVMGGYRAPGYRGFREEPSAHQMRNLEKVTDWLQHIFEYGNEGLFGHCTVGSKAACPGFWGIEWLEQRRADVIGLETVEDWQQALKMWNKEALPKYGVDGDWGAEGKFWLRRFQDSVGIKPTAFQDVFTELMLMRAVGWKGKACK